jgi:LruC domain-containing protein
MNKKMTSISLILAIAGLTLFYQNCARIGYGPSDHVNKNTIDGTLDAPPTPGDLPVVEFPESAKKKMTVSFEDLMTRTNNSQDTDLDYNDFVFTYNVREENKDGYLDKIEITVTPQAKHSGYNDQLLLGLQGPIAGSGESLAEAGFFNSNSIQAKIEYYDQDDQLISTQALDVTQPVVVFNKTNQIFLNGDLNLTAGTSADPIKVLCKEKAKTKAKITVTGFSQREENKARNKIDTKRYPFYLYIYDTKILMGTIDLHPKDKSKNGYPMGFQVPGTFLHPAERVNISTVYPYFNDYVKLINNQALDPLRVENAKAWSDWVSSDWATKLACSPSP